jgi:hypothetical protein
MFEELISTLILAQLAATGGLYWRLFRHSLAIERRLSAIETHIQAQIHALDTNPPAWFRRGHRD